MLTGVRGVPMITLKYEPLQAERHGLTDSSISAGEPIKTRHWIAVSSGDGLSLAD